MISLFAEMRRADTNVGDKSDMHYKYRRMHSAIGGNDKRCSFRISCYVGYLLSDP